MGAFSGLFMPDGSQIYTQEYVQGLRDQKTTPNIFAQAGGQEDCLACPAQLIFYGGLRGGGKSYVLLINSMYDILNRNFRACILRNEKTLSKCLMSCIASSENITSPSTI